VTASVSADLFRLLGHLGSVRANPTPGAADPDRRS
jgi:hypothetical protein